jgi:Family of unknown function (DUF6441)
MALRQSTFGELVFDSAALRQLKARAERDYLQAARNAVQQAGRRVELELESAYAGAGLGKLARAWSSKVFPRSGISDAPTVDIRPKGKARTVGSIRAYARGANIKSKPGQFLAIPLRAAGPRFVGRGKQAIGPQEWQRRTGIRLSPARIGGKLYLVANAVRSKKTGRVAVKATERRLASGRATERLLVFLLLDEVKVQQRVNVDAIFARGASYLVQEFDQEVRAFAARTAASGQ